MTLGSPDISVVTPVFNGERYIGETIAAVRAQTFSNFEYLIIDDCSTDNTAAIIAAAAESDPRITFLRTSRNSGGPATPRNVGVGAARGKWVAFCDADDLWVPEKLAIQRSVVEKVNGALYCSGIRDFKDGTIPITPTPTPTPSAGLPSWKEISLDQMLVKNWIAMSSVLVARDTLGRVGPFNFRPEFISVEDYDLWLRTLEMIAMPAIRIDSALVLYRRGATSISANKFKMLQKANMVQGRHFERVGRASWFKLTRPCRMARYLAVAVWMRGLRGEL